MQHRAQRPAPGRHRRESPPTLRHQMLGSRGRHAVLAATLIAGVGAAALASGGHAQAKSATPIAAPAAAHTEIDPAPATDMPELAVTPSVEDAALVAPTLSSVRALRKARPVAVPVQLLVPVARWVNPLPQAVVTSCFGMRWGRLHAGVDLAAPTGTPIHSAGAGTVVSAGVEGGYGNAVLIDHGDGYLTHYGHMSAITVTVGQRVLSGQQIGNEGSTGHSTGPHLHFEVHRGQYKNPIEPTQWMHEHGVDIRGCVTFTDPAKKG